MNKLTIRFINSDSFLGRAIDYVEGGAGLLDHAEFGTPEGTWIGAHDKGGVQERPADYVKPDREFVYDVPVEDDICDRVMAFARSQIGKPYDFETIVGILFHKNLHDEGRWICSELVCAACIAGGLPVLNVLPGFTQRITPEMLHLSPVLIGHRRPFRSAGNFGGTSEQTNVWKGGDTP